MKENTYKIIINDASENSSLNDICNKDILTNNGKNIIKYSKLKDIKSEKKTNKTNNLLFKKYLNCPLDNNVHEKNNKYLNKQHNNTQLKIGYDLNINNPKSNSAIKIGKNKVIFKDIDIIDNKIYSKSNIIKKNEANIRNKIIISNIINKIKNFNYNNENTKDKFIYVKEDCNISKAKSLNIDNNMKKKFDNRIYTEFNNNTNSIILTPKINKTSINSISNQIIKDKLCGNSTKLNNKITFKFEKILKSNLFKRQKSYKELKYYYDNIKRKYSYIDKEEQDLILLSNKYKNASRKRNHSKSLFNPKLLKGISKKVEFELESGYNSNQQKKLELLKMQNDSFKNELKKTKKIKNSKIKEAITIKKQIELKKFLFSNSEYLNHTLNVGVFNGFSVMTTPNLKNTNEDNVLISFNNRIKNNREHSQSNDEEPTGTIDDKLLHLFGIFDGHRGTKTSSFLKDEIVKKIITHKNILNEIDITLFETFKKIEKHLEKEALKKYDKKEDIDLSGTCCLLLLNLDKDIYIVNIGDSNSMISVNNSKEISNLSILHNKSNKNEMERIVKNRGSISLSENTKNDKILPFKLSTTRSIGDVFYKVKKIGGYTNLISSEPEIFHFDVNNINADYIILGSKELFEFLSKEEICVIIWNTLKDSIIIEDTYSYFLSKVCHNIIIEAVSKHAEDNLSIIFFCMNNLYKIFEDKDLEKIQCAINNINLNPKKNEEQLFSMVDQIFYFNPNKEKSSAFLEQKGNINKNENNDDNNNENHNKTNIESSKIVIHTVKKRKKFFFCCG